MYFSGGEALDLLFKWARVEAAAAEEGGAPASTRADTVGRQAPCVLLLLSFKACECGRGARLKTLRHQTTGQHV